LLSTNIARAHLNDEEEMILLQYFVLFYLQSPFHPNNKHIHARCPDILAGHRGMVYARKPRSSTETKQEFCNQFGMTDQVGNF